MNKAKRHTLVRRTIIEGIIRTNPGLKSADVFTEYVRCDERKLAGLGSSLIDLDLKWLRDHRKSYSAVAEGERSARWYPVPHDLEVMSNLLTDQLRLLKTTSRQLKEIEEQKATIKSEAVEGEEHA
jgi:hypothetical protein